MHFRMIGLMRIDRFLDPNRFEAGPTESIHGLIGGARRCMGLTGNDGDRLSRIVQRDAKASATCRTNATLSRQLTFDVERFLALMAGEAYPHGDYR